MANAAEFLLSDQSSWITGQVMRVDGGMSTLTVTHRCWGLPIPILILVLILMLVLDGKLKSSIAISRDCDS